MPLIIGGLVRVSVPLEVMFLNVVVLVPATAPVPANITPPVVVPLASNVPLLVKLPPLAMVRLYIPDMVSVAPLAIVTEAAFASAFEITGSCGVPAGMVTPDVEVGL